MIPHMKHLFIIVPAVAAACMTFALASKATNRAGPDDLSKVTAENEGARKYALYCGGCHGLDGRGEVGADVPSLPPFVGSFLHDPEGKLYLVNVGGVMAADVSDADTAEILNYMIDRFGVNSKPENSVLFSASEVASLRSKPIDAVSVRRGIAARLKKKDVKLPEGYPWP